jgi:hypothetical protein
MQLSVILQYVVVLVCIFSFMTGCAPKTRYTWNGYDEKLYQHYKNPTEYEQFIENLQNVIDEGTGSGTVPPGIYAEYGFAMYEKGNMPEAARYFKMESDKWPESRFFMNKMIQNTEKRQKQAKPPKPIEATAATVNAEDPKVSNSKSKEVSK